jgi:hypothetical protein
MTNPVLRLKVKATRSYREFRSVAPYTQYDDLIGTIDIIAVEDCERILAEMKGIFEQQCNLTTEELKNYEYRSLNK